MRMLGIRLSTKSPSRRHPARDSVRSDDVRRFSSMGVPPMSIRGILPLHFHGQDARGTHGRDGRATMPVRAHSEEWTHQVDSLVLRMESVWTVPCTCDAVGAGPRARPEGSDTAQGATQAQGAGQPRGVAPTSRGCLE